MTLQLSQARAAESSYMGEQGGPMSTVARVEDANLISMLSCAGYISFHFLLVSKLLFQLYAAYGVC